MDQYSIPMSARDIYQAELNTALDVYNTALNEESKEFEASVDRFVVDAINAAKDAYHKVFNEGLELIMQQVDNGLAEESESKEFEKLREAANKAAEESFDQLVSVERQAAKERRRINIDQARKTYLQACTLAEKKLMETEGANM